MRRRITNAIVLAVVVLGLAVGAADCVKADVTVPIDPSLLTIDSTPGVVSWTGNNLTLDISKGGPLYGGYTQTKLLNTSVLPQNVVGMSFDISSSLQNPRVSFGYNVYDSAGYGQG